jgi:hypothetical protein
VGYCTRLAATYVALLAILLHGLIPAGWMPSGGGAPITICAMDGAVHLAAARSNIGHKQSPGDQHRQEVCPFAAAPHFSTPVIAATIPAPAQYAIAVTGAAHRTFRFAARPYSLQPPRAPPQSVTA